MSFFEQLQGELIDKISMGVIKFGVVVLVAGLAACGSQKVDQCDKDSDCTNIAYPFCDVNGEYSPSGGEAHVCTVPPSDCPVDRCGCSPGATTCDGDQETTCNVDGKSTTTSTCSLGCADSKDHCLAFEPSNGLGPAMAAAGNEHDVVFPTSIRINTDTGMVFDTANAPVQVTSLVSGNIRVYIAHSFVLSDVTVSGSKALAFVAPGLISLGGTILASASGTTAGPGAGGGGDCVGTFGSAGGGGGNGTAGGAGYTPALGGNTSVAGGLLQTAFAPLQGGCSGGGASAGAGGGALQFDSFVKISGASTATINLGGGGADATEHDGGGSGGTVIFEAPTVIIGGGIFANGGAGSACGISGPNGTATVSQAVGPSCGNQGHGGNGGTGTVAPGAGGGPVDSAGGGGAVGRMHVSTLDGTYSTGAGAIVSAVTTTDSLILK
ncbi:MAG: hypothetical protein ABI591_01710 [Kofleriaceae bacterium]